MGKDAVASSGSGKKCRVKNNFQEARRCLSARDKLTATIDERTVLHVQSWVQSSNSVSNN